MQKVLVQELPWKLKIDHQKRLIPVFCRSSKFNFSASFWELFLLFRHLEGVFSIHSTGPPQKLKNMCFFVVKLVWNRWLLNPSALEKILPTKIPTCSATRWANGQLLPHKFDAASFKPLWRSGWKRWKSVTYKLCNCGPLRTLIVKHRKL